MLETSKAPAAGLSLAPRAALGKTQGGGTSAQDLATVPTTARTNHLPASTLTEAQSTLPSATTRSTSAAALPQGQHVKALTACAAVSQRMRWPDQKQETPEQRVGCCTTHSKHWRVCGRRPKLAGSTSESGIGTERVRAMCHHPQYNRACLQLALTGVCVVRVVCVRSDWTSLSEATIIRYI